MDRINDRLARDNQPKGGPPVLKGGNVVYEVAERIRAVAAGGLGMIQQLFDAVGLRETLDERLSLLKQYKPYRESDHVLSLVFNILSGGQCLGDIQQRRRDDAYLDALGAQRIPDSTTSGDFLRRFQAEDVEDLIGGMNEVSARVWQSLPARQRQLATIDVDGTIVETSGECKERMDVSYDNRWGFGPLLVSLANTQEVLSIFNRSANRPSHDGCVPWIDAAVDWAREEAGFERVLVRGDTDFSLTANFDRWTDEGVQFVFGIDAHASFKARARDLPEDSWAPLERKEQPSAQRRRAERVKQRMIEERGFRNLSLVAEHVAELPYQPRKSTKKNTYRMVVLRKRIRVTKGQTELEDEIRYHFYVTNVPEAQMDTASVVFESNARCDQENLIEQLKNGVQATRLPVREFDANWAYLVIGALAWNAKVWCAQLLPDEDADRLRILRMEFRRFLNELILLPAQILTSARSLVFRFLAVNEWVPLLMEGTQRLKRCRLA